VTKAARRTFHSLRYRNYRLFFGGQIVSQTGSWMQRIALGWFILQLTHSAFDVGVMAFAQFAPYMFFGLFAGVLADRLDARRTVLATQTAQLITASALAWIALGGFAVPWMLYTIAFINGTVLVLDVPSRQQLTYRMVGREDLPNAIALNSTLFNASRIFGPSVDLARLIASANTRRPINSREVRSLRSLPDLSLYIALMVPTIGRLVARSSEKVLREIAPSTLSPTAS